MRCFDLVILRETVDLLTRRDPVLGICIPHIRLSVHVIPSHWVSSQYQECKPIRMLASIGTSD